MILFFQMPFLFPLLEEKKHPFLSNTAYVITRGDPPVVLYPSIMAYKSGYRRYDPISHIKKGIKQIKPDIMLYKSAESKILSILSSFSPLIESSMHGFFLDISGNDWKYSYIQEISDEIFHSLYRAFSTKIFIGIGSSKLISLLASELLVPALQSRIIYIPPHTEALFLKYIPISLLPDTDNHIIETLHLLNINTIGDLSLLSHSFLYQLFHESGSKLHNFARGMSGDNFNNIFSRNSLFLDISFSPTNNISIIKAKIYSILEDMCYKLREIKKEANKARLHIGFEDKRYLKRHIKINHFSCIETDFYEETISAVSFERIRRVNINYIGIEVYNLVPASKQKNLIASVQTKKRKLLDAVFNIRKKYGKEKLNFKFLPKGISN